MLDIKKVQDEAKKEVMEEKMADAKKRIKKKLSEIEDAKTVLANLEREYQDILDAISQGN